MICILTKEPQPKFVLPGTVSQDFARPNAAHLCVTILSAIEMQRFFLELNDKGCLWILGVVQET